MLSKAPVLADVSPGGIHGRCDGCGAAREVCLGSQPAHGQGHAKYRLVSNPVSRWLVPNGCLRGWRDRFGRP